MKIMLLGSGTIGSSLSARLVSLGRSLVADGHDVTLVLPHTDKYSNHLPARVDTLHGMSVVHPRQLNTRNATANLLTYVPSAAWHVLRSRSDIVHIYKPTPLTVVGLIKRWNRWSRIVVDLDDLGFAVLAREGHHALKVRLVRWSESQAARSADAIITASSYLQETVQATYPNKPVAWIPNGVQGVANRSAPLPNPGVVFVGSLNAGNSAWQLIESLPEVLRALGPRTLRVTVIGDGTERTALMDRVAELGLSDLVTFTAWVAYERLSDHVPVGSLGVCCAPQTETARAASNQKVFDYFSLGAVPVVSAVGDLPYYVDHGRSGYIVEGDLATTLAKAISDDVGRLERVDAGRRFLEEKFLWSTLAGEVETLYASLVPAVAGTL